MEDTSKLQNIDNCSMLITAISAGDLDTCLQILDLLSQRELDELVRVSVSERMFMVTPLISAVNYSRTEIVKLLLKRGVDVNRQGYLKSKYVTHTYTPLTRALDNRDREMVEILLVAGADPYSKVSDPRIFVEEGGSGLNERLLYPVGKAIASDDLEMVQTFMQSYDPATYNINKYHMCLCFVLCKRKLKNWFDIVRCIISYGGKVCSGVVVRNQSDQGICFYFKLLADRLAFTIHHVHFACKFECNFSAFKILSLICKTDYNRPSSSIVKVLQKKLSFFDKRRVGNVDNFVCRKSYEFFHEVLNFCETPTSLKQICCVTIRENIRRLTPAKCSQLPLPSVLQRYIAFLDEN